MSRIRQPLYILLICACGIGQTAAAGQSPDRCIEPAAVYHAVNADILRAILTVESRMNPNTVTKNSNGSIDVGIAGINSIHFKDLAKVGVAPSDLLDACVATYVAAWKVSKKMARWGNNWFGIAAYHSETPYFNQRYQVLLQNQLVRSGVLAGSIAPVPPLRRPSSPAAAAPNPAAASVAPASQSVGLTNQDRGEPNGGPVRVRITAPQS